MIAEGKLHAKIDIQQVTDTFRKREFVLEYADNPMYPQYVKFELIQDRVTLVDAYEVGDKIEITFNLRGRQWTSPQGETKYFNTLDAWRIQKIEAENGAPAAEGSGVYDMAAEMSKDDGADDLPF